MFNPAAREQAKAALAEKRRVTSQIKEWASALIPVELQDGLQIDVKEVECGDPVSTCSYEVLFPSYMLCPPYFPE